MVEIAPQVHSKSQHPEHNKKKSIAVKETEVEAVSSRKIKLYLAYAKKCEKSGQLGKAINVYRKILNQQPEHNQALLNLALLYYRENNLNRAEKLLSQAEQFKTNSWMNSYLFALVKIAQDEPTDAISHLERTLELNPNYEPANKLISEIRNNELAYRS